MKNTAIIIGAALGISYLLYQSTVKQKSAQIDRDSGYTPRPMSKAARTIQSGGSIVESGLDVYKMIRDRRDRKRAAKAHATKVTAAAAKGFNTLRSQPEAPATDSPIDL